MPRGRKPDAPGVQEVKGNPRKQRIAPAATSPQPGQAVTSILQADAQLPPSAQAIWRDLAPELERLNFLRVSDRPAFARYCMHLADWWRHTRLLAEEGETQLVKSEHVPEGMNRINPRWKIREALDKLLIAYEDRIGLNPVARQQIMLRVASQMSLLPPDKATGTEAPQPAAAPPSSPVGVLGSATRH